MSGVPAQDPRLATVTRAAEAAGVPARIRVLDVHVPTAADAAAALGCPVGAIANSLIFDAAGEAVLVMASGAARIDPALAAAALGVAELKRATAAQVAAATGQVIGGVAPTGHPTRLRAVVDVELAAYDELWAGAGTVEAMMALTYDELLRLTGGTPARVR